MATPTTVPISVADQVFDTGRRSRHNARTNIDCFTRSERGSIPPKQRQYVIDRALEQWSTGEQQQMAALADGVGKSFHEVALYNLLPSLSREDDCSVYAALGSTTRNGLTVFGKNSDKQGDSTLVGDNYRFHREINVVTDYRTENGLRVLGLAAAGKLGLKISVNSAGIAGGTNYSHTREEQLLRESGKISVGDQLAQDRAMLLRRGMEFSDAKQAAVSTLNAVIESPMATPGNLEFADSVSGHVVESSYHDAALTAYNHGFLIRTNRFESLDHLNGEAESSDRRYARIKELLASKNGDISADYFEAISSDHTNGPSALSICTHGAGHGSRTMGAMVVSFEKHDSPPSYAFVAGSPCAAWQSRSGVARGVLTVNSPEVPMPFRDGTAWTEHYISDELAP